MVQCGCSPFIQAVLPFYLLLRLGKVVPSFASDEGQCGLLVKVGLVIRVPMPGQAKDPPQGVNVACCGLPFFNKAEVVISGPKNHGNTQNTQ
jgi:hypothetical protein